MTKQVCARKCACRCERLYAPSASINDNACMHERMRECALVKAYASFIVSFTNQGWRKRTHEPSEWTAKRSNLPNALRLTHSVN